MLFITLFMTDTRFCSTSLPAVNSLTKGKVEYTVQNWVALILDLAIVMSYLQVDHLMVIESVYQLQINLVT
jgi:hypothetical protein